MPWPAAGAACPASHHGWLPHPHGRRRHRRFVLARSRLLCSSVIAVLHSSLGANYEALGLVYLPAVIGVAFLFGLRAGVLTAIAAAPSSTPCCCRRRGLKTPDSRVWLLFAALLLSGAAVAELAARERRRSEQAYEREREAALLAGLSSALVGGASLELAQVDAARVAAAAIGAPAARIVFGRGPLAGQVALPLDVDGRVIGRLELMGADARRLDDENAQRVARSLAGVLALAQERERLAHADVEAEALRASDALKTALLRAVSHELRTPLTAIKAAVGRVARRSGAARRGGGARAARRRQHRDRPPRPPRLRPARRLAPAGRQRLDGARLVRGRRPAARRRRCRPLARAGTRASRSRPTTSCRSCTATPRRSSACSST